MESSLINDMRSPTSPTPPAPLPVESHGQRKGVVMVVVFIIILLILAFWLADIKPSGRHDGAGNAITDAPEGELVAGFPVELLREQDAVIGSSYSIEYAKEGKEMPFARYVSGESYAENIEGFRSLLQGSGWIIQKDASVSETPITGFYASKDTAEANIVLAQNADNTVMVQISYITTTQ